MIIKYKNMNIITKNNLPNYYSKCIEIAINTAHKSEMLQKHGCVIAMNGKIISTGFNNLRNHSKDGLIDCCSSCHAEISAIRNIPCLAKLSGKYKQWV
jgi:deoxycytidylate deaminase